jgi:hypothetical protein
MFFGIRKDSDVVKFVKYLWPWPLPCLPQELQPELDLSRIICSFVKRTDTALQVTILVEYSIVIQRALEISTVHHIEELRAKLGG